MLVPVVAALLLANPPVASPCVPQGDTEAIAALRQQGGMFTVSGTITDAGGQPTMGGELSLMETVRANPTPARRPAVISSSGRFIFRDVPPGQYVIHAFIRSRRDSEGDFGCQAVTVSDHDIAGVRVRMSSGQTELHGRVVLNRVRELPLPAPDAVEIVAVPGNFDLAPRNDWARGEVSTTGAFRLRGLRGTRRVSASRLPPGWAIERVVFGDTDVTDQPIDVASAEPPDQPLTVVLTDTAHTITGRGVVDAPLQPWEAVVVFSLEPARWIAFSRFVKIAAPALDGSFSIHGLLPGRYAIARTAWTREAILDSLVWNRGQLLEELLGEARTIEVHQDLDNVELDGR